MAERFEVDPGHVAGYGQLCGEVSAANGFDGVLMGELVRSRGQVLDSIRAW